MPVLTDYGTESYVMEPSRIKNEPDRTPPHNIYSPAGPSYSEAQWTPLEPMGAQGAFGESWQHAQPQFQYSPYHRSPHPHQAGQGSPLGAMSPTTHATLQPPINPTVGHGAHSPLHGGHGAPSPLHGGHGAPSPLHGAHSPLLAHGAPSPQQGGPGGPSLSPALHQPYQGPIHQQPALYQLNQMTGGEQMETGTSISELLNRDVGPLPDHELFSLASLEQSQENLSDSLRNLSTTDLLNFPRQ